MIGNTWRKSSYSGGQGNCVEVRSSEDDTVVVRDSKNVPGPELAVTAGAWSEFAEAVKHGEFDV